MKSLQDTKYQMINFSERISETLVIFVMYYGELKLFTLKR